MKNLLFPREGWLFVWLFGMAGITLLMFGNTTLRILGGMSILMASFCAFFFRDPVRAVPITEDLLSPADGRVLEVLETPSGEYKPGQVVRIFLSIFDVHTQRAPEKGTITSVRHTPGSFLHAGSPRAHIVNENMLIEMETSCGWVAVRQIAGFIARRTVCWVKTNQEVMPGDRLGMIRFGSQVDLYVPSHADIIVKPGDRVVGGVTPMARWKEEKFQPDARHNTNSIPL